MEFGALPAHGGRRRAHHGSPKDASFQLGPRTRSASGRFASDAAEEGMDHGQRMDLLVVRLDEDVFRWRWLVNAAVAARSDPRRAAPGRQGRFVGVGHITSRGRRAASSASSVPAHVLQGRTLDADRMPAPAVSALHSAGRGFDQAVDREASTVSTARRSFTSDSRNLRCLQGCGWIRSVRSTPTGSVLRSTLNISGIRSQPGQAPTRQWSICEHPLRPRVT